MKFLYRLRMKLAYWLLPRDVTTFQPNIQSVDQLDRSQLARLSGLLSSLLSMEPQSMLRMAATLQVEHQIAQQKLETEKMYAIGAQKALAPHRTYSPALYNDGISWIAKGDFSNETSLVGRGNCPAAALKDYDDQWAGIK